MATEASRLLVAWVGQQTTKTAAAKALGVSLPTLLAYCDGYKRPRDVTRQIVAEVAGIAEDLWVTDDERAHRERVLAAHAASVDGGEAEQGAA